MSKRGNRHYEFPKCKEKIAKKRMRKKESNSAVDMEYITTQLLSDIKHGRKTPEITNAGLEHVFNNRSFTVGCQPTIHKLTLKRLATSM